MEYFDHRFDFCNRHAGLDYAGNGLAGSAKSAKRPTEGRNVPRYIQTRIFDIIEILALLTKKYSILRINDNTELVYLNLV